MTKYLIPCIALLLNGCMSLYKTHGADGREAYAFNCSGAEAGWDQCFQAAGYVCGSRGYDILDRSGEDVSVVSASDNAFNAAQSYQRSLLISCKDPQTTSPA